MIYSGSSYPDPIHFGPSIQNLRIHRPKNINKFKFICIFILTGSKRNNSGPGKSSGSDRIRINNNDIPVYTYAVLRIRTTFDRIQIRLKGPDPDPVIRFTSCYMTFYGWIRILKMCPDPDPRKRSRSDRIQIRIRNTAQCAHTSTGISSTPWLWLALAQLGWTLPSRLLRTFSETRSTVWNIFKTWNIFINLNQKDYYLYRYRKVKVTNSNLVI